MIYGYHIVIYYIFDSSEWSLYIKSSSSCVFALCRLVSTNRRKEFSWILFELNWLIGSKHSSLPDGTWGLLLDIIIQTHKFSKHILFMFFKSHLFFPSGLLAKTFLKYYFLFILIKIFQISDFSKTETQLPSKIWRMKKWPW